MSDMIEIGILGMGNIGSEFVEILQKQTAEIEQASNKKIQISKILVSNLNKKRNTGVNDNVLTTNPDEIFKSVYYFLKKPDSIEKQLLEVKSAINNLKSSTSSSDEASKILLSYLA